MLFGGATRPDVLAPLVPRVFAVLALTALVIRRETGIAGWSRMEKAVWLLLLAVPLVQLVPLPWTIWQTLPGRDYAHKLFAMMGVTPAQPISLAPERTVNAFCALLPAFAAYVLAREWDDRTQSRAFAMVLGFALFDALLAALQVTGGAGSPLRFYAVTVDDAGVGLFSNPNHLGGFLAACLPLVALFSGTGRVKNALPGSQKFLAAAGLFLIALGALLSFSRAGIGLGLVAAIPATLLLMPPGWRPAPRSIAIGAAAIIACAVLGFVQRDALVQFTQLDQEGGRTDLLPGLLRMARDGMPFGFGMGSLDPVYRGYESFARLGFGYLNNAHNDYLQLVIEAGVAALAGLALFALFGLRVGTGLWRARRELPSQRQRTAIAAATVVAVMLVHSAVDYPLRGAAVSVLFALSCGCLARYWQQLQDVSSGESREFGTVDR